MIEILKQLGFSALGVILLTLLFLVGKEVWGIVKAKRLQSLHDTLSKMLDELDHRISEFYLPMYQRLITMESLFNVTRSWLNTKSEYHNSILNIKSSNSRALRNIVVRRFFLPLNTGIENLILNQLYHKVSTDDTDYSKLLFHYTMWRALEEAIINDEIESYSASDLLTFPAEEAEKQKRCCRELLEKQNTLRKKIIKLEKVLFHWIPKS
ncbi:MAG: hypothetical protein U5O15_08095 [Candidatus Krumholzibacteriota bacterium]|nr:hypothetical protein [Candidatus Krumholzibacteriota bacterium]